MLNLRNLLIGIVAFVPTLGNADSDIDNMHVGQIKTTKEYGATIVSFKLANTSNYKGDVLFWFMQNGVRKCEHIGNIPSNKKFNVGIRCDSLGAGKFEIIMAKPEEAPSIAAIANRM